MSAHVVPKAKPFPDEEEEEKTTIESGWEDEASTTVEQGEVADKIRALGSEQQPVTPPRRQQGTGVTSTGASQLDEPTVDDQHVAEIANNIAQGLARLIIAQGNDVGQEFEIRPGKSYTIGRAIDNDVVLTDIAVSRKHFDLRFQDSAWVIVDRGSGNGTVVNGNVEDNPFMLASGDAIEIGNTVFRFEQPNGTPRRFASYSDEEEELSTVAGKVVRHDLEPDPPAAPLQTRGKTLPPPTPLRPRSPSQFPAQPMPPIVAPQPASTLPLPQMSGRAPVGQAPTMLAADPVSAPMQAMMQQPSQPYAMQQRAVFNDYPQYSEMPPGQGLGPLVVPQNGQRLDPSTAHVAPTPYAMNGMMSAPMAVARPMPGGPLSKRTKMILGGVGLALLAGITTIAIVSGGSKKPSSQSAATGSAAPITAQKPEAPKQEPPKQDPPKIVATPIEQPKPEPPKQEPPKVVVVPPPPPPKQEPPKKEPPVVVAKKDPPPVVKKDPPPKKDPPVVVKKDPPPPKQEPVHQEKKDPPKRVAAVDTGEARTKADGLYRAKRFSEAAATLASAAKSADDSEAKELRHIADLYVKVGRGLSSGTAPAAAPTDAFPTLRQTENFDRAAGGAFTTEIETALKKVAPKAASAYLADKNYEQARLAVIEADKQGANTTIFKQALERAAADMYNQAAKEASSDAASAKDKCQRILNFADPKSPWYAKAAKLKTTL